MTDATVAKAFKSPFRRLIWLMPVAFALHIAEEYLGGFASWVTNVVGGSMNGLAFALNNAAFMTIMLILTAWASFSGSRLACLVLIVWASANLFWDAIFHIIATAAFNRYSPGLITASLLYMPISAAVASAALRGHVVSLRPFVTTVALGAALLGLVIWYGLFHFAI